MYGRIMCFVNCHFAAHLDAVGRRNADFDHVYQTMSFSRPTNLLNATPGTMAVPITVFVIFLIHVFYLSLFIGFPLVLSVAAGTSSSVPVFRGTNVCTCCPFYSS